MHGGVLANYQFKSHHCHTIIFGSLKILFLIAVLKMPLNGIKYWSRRQCIVFPDGSLVRGIKPFSRQGNKYMLSLRHIPLLKEF